MIGLGTLLIFLAALLPGPADAAIATPTFVPKLGTRLDTGLIFRDQTGRSAPLGDFLGGRPALVLFGYDRCPGLCGVAQADLAGALRKTGIDAHRYHVVFASIDPGETPADAAAAREKLAEAVLDASLADWSFLTGPARSVAALDRAAGLSVTALPGRSLYVHPVATLVLTADGRISRGFGGLAYGTRDLRLALVEASDGKLGTLSDQLTVLCSSFDPSTGRYSSAIMIGLRMAGIATLLAMGLTFLILRRRGAPP
jgi:protein SCO1/2